MQQRDIHTAVTSTGLITTVSEEIRAAFRVCWRDVLYIISERGIPRRVPTRYESISETEIGIAIR